MFISQYSRSVPTDEIIIYFYVTIKENWMKIPNAEYAYEPQSAIINFAFCPNAQT